MKYPLYDQFKSSIVRISNENGVISGAGFLTSERNVITCAHVVAEALGIAASVAEIPTRKVIIDFPLVKKGGYIPSSRKIPGKVIVWNPVTDPPMPKSDIAVIELEDKPPAGSHPGRVVATNDLWGHSFRTYGFPGKSEIDDWTFGVILDELMPGWVQIKGSESTARFVQPGFSGSPVWDNQEKGIVGIVVRADPSSHIKSAYIIPSTLLIEVWHDLGETAIPPCPYRGLFHFEEQHAPFFFGREAFTQDLVKTVCHKPLVAVVGPSGSGKSSVVFAGLIPALRKDEDWLIAHFRPGNRPYNNLATSLITLLEPKMSETDKLQEISKLTQFLIHGENALQDVVERIIEKNAPSSSLLLVVDQIEELFTQCNEAEMRLRFIDTILEAISMKSYWRRRSLALVMTLRADFMAYALSYRPLADALQNSDQKLGPMNPEELRAAIEEPGKKLNVTIEDGLTERLLEAVAQSPGNLLLLQFALKLLWEKQSDGKLTHEAYEEIGGVKSALARYAEEELSKFAQGDEQEKVRRVFTQLVCSVEGTGYARRKATRREIGEEKWRIVPRLADTRLIVSGRDEKTGEETIEIVHEALIREWRRMQEWLEEDHNFRTWQQRLRTLKNQSDACSGDTGALLRGAPLMEANDWMLKRGSDLSEEDKGFIQASLAFRQSQKAARERSQRRKIFWVSTALIISMILGSLALLFWLRAEISKKEILARKLIFQAELTRNQQPNLHQQSVLLAVKAMHLSRHPSIDACLTLRHGLELLPRFLLSIDPNREVNVIAFSPDGRYLATAGDDNSVRLWTMPDGQKVSLTGDRDISHQKRIHILTFSLDGRYLATASDDQTACVWSIPSGRKIVTLSHEDYHITDLAFSPEGRYLATASDDQTACVWAIPSGRRIATLSHDDYVASIVFSPDGNYLATASWDKTARLWNISNTLEVFCLVHSGYVHAVSLSPDGRYLATACSDHTARLWDSTTGREIVNMLHYGCVRAIAFSPDGKYLVSAADDLTARIWEMPSGQNLTRLQHNGRVNALHISADSRYLSTSSDDGTARMWDVRTGKEVIRIGHKNNMVAIALSPKGKYIATAAAGQNTRVWEAKSLGKDDVLFHNTGVSHLVFSPDGRYVATVSLDKGIRVMERESEKESPPMRHDWPISAIAFATDGRSLVTGGEDRTARFWNVESGQEELRLSDNPSGIKAITFSPDGRYCATAHDDGAICVRKGIRYKEFAYVNHANQVCYLAFSPDGKYLASGGLDRVARLWDAGTWLQIAQLEHESEVLSGAFSPLGDYLATSCTDKTIWLWNIPEGTKVNHMKHTNRVNNIAFGTDKNYLAGACSDHTIRIWNTRTFEETARVQHEDEVLSVAFSMDGNYLASGGRDRTARLWDARRYHKIDQMEHPVDILAIAISPDKKYLATAGADSTARIFEVSSRKKVREIKHDWDVTAVAFSPDGKYLATSSDDRTTRLWDAQKGIELFRIKHTANLNSLSFNPDGRFLCTVEDDRYLRIWDANGQEARRIRHTGQVAGIAFDKEGRFITATIDTHTIQIWETEFIQGLHEKGKSQAAAGENSHKQPWERSPGKEIAHIAHEGIIGNLTFSPEGKYLAAISDGNQLHVWKTSDGRKILDISQEGRIADLTFSADGAYLAMVHAERTAHIYEVLTGRGVALMEPESHIYDITFSPDGRYLVTTCADQTSRFWIWRPEDMIHEACRRLCRNLTEEEVYKYLGDKHLNKTHLNLP
jgi:WD40 repeat protein